MLQIVHHNNRAPRASSLYCQWILESCGMGETPVAVWIDTAMRCFEREFLVCSRSEIREHSLLEKSGSGPGVELSRIPSAKESTFHQL